MQVSMRMHRDRVGITMRLFTKFYYGFFFCNTFMDGLVL